MTLEQYLKKYGISAERFATKIANPETQKPFTGMTIRRWVTGEQMPDADVIERITKATRGEVKVIDLHNSRLAYLRRVDPRPAPRGMDGAS